MMLLVARQVLSLEAQASTSSLPNIQEPLGHWAAFKAIFGKTFLNASHEEQHHSIFRDNLAYIERRNREQNSFKLGINHFADLDPDMFRQRFSNSNVSSRGFLRSKRKTFIFDTNTISSLPSYVDWRAKGAVNPIKNQGQCGSCWSFATIASVEGAYAIATGSLRSLSEQQLLDCSTSNHGCIGGNIDLALEYIEQNGGVDSDTDYPYMGAQGTCDTARNKRIVARIGDFRDVVPRNEDQLLAAVMKGPVAAAVEADQRDFQFYQSGVFDGTCGNKIDHGVTIVGYTPDAWIIRNSWGESWGDNGYMYLKRIRPSKDHPAGLCGLLSMPSFPLVDDRRPLPIPKPTPSPPPGLKCDCTLACENMCVQIGMRCCSGKNGDCNCQPPRDSCCDSSSSSGDYYNMEPFFSTSSLSTPSKMWVEKTIQ